MVNRSIIFFGLMALSLTVNGAIWNYQISGDLKWLPESSSIDPAPLDGRALELSFQVDDTLRTISPNEASVIFPVLESTLVISDPNEGEMITTYALSGDPFAGAVRSLIVNKYEASEATRLQYFNGFSIGPLADIAYHELGFYDQNLPRQDIFGADLAALYYYTGSVIYAVDNEVLVISSVPVPASAWLFGSSVLGLMGVLRVKGEHPCAARHI
jgi:hypothetical protein